MTPKEKAEELFNSFFSNIESFYSETEARDVYGISIQQAKQCALIAVDQVLESIPPLITLEGFGSALFENDDVIWWKEVKQELEKL